MGSSKSFSDDESDDNCGELVATFGMLRSDLVEMLASIVVASDGLDQLIRTSRGLTTAEMNVLISAIENNNSLISVFSLGGEITVREVDACASKINLRVDLMRQSRFLQESLMNQIKSGTNLTNKEIRMKYCNENPDPDPLIAEALGDEYT